MTSGTNGICNSRVVFLKWVCVCVCVCVCVFFCWYEEGTLSFVLFRATLDEVSRSRVQWNRAILLAESHKIELRAVWWGSKTKKWQLEEAKPTWHNFGGKINQLVGTQINEDIKGERAHNLGKPRCKLGSKVRDKLKDSICFKWVQIGSSEFELRTPI